MKIISEFKKEEKHKPRKWFNIECDCGKEFSMRQANYYYYKKLNKNISCGCKKKSIKGGTKQTINYKYNYNTNFFKELTPDSAYVLGLLYTDGNLSKSTEKRKRYSITLVLHESDKYLLEKVSLLIKGDSHLNKKSKSSNCYVMSLNNKEIYQDLLNWGLYPNKSATIVPDRRLLQNRDFWRGCVDGDGCLHSSKKNQLSLSLSGNFGLTNEFKNYCAQFINLSNYKLKPVSTIGLYNTYQFQITTKKAQVIFNKLYSSTDNLQLKRKYEIGYNHLSKTDIKFLNKLELFFRQSIIDL